MTYVEALAKHYTKIQLILFTDIIEIWKRASARSYQMQTLRSIGGKYLVFITAKKYAIVGLRWDDMRNVLHFIIQYTYLMKSW